MVSAQVRVCVHLLIEALVSRVPGPQELLTVKNSVFMVQEVLDSSDGGDVRRVRKPFLPSDHSRPAQTYLKMLTTNSREMFWICVFSRLCQSRRWQRRVLASVPTPR